MTQCAGTTLKGERCRREASEGSSYCSIHFEQPPRPAEEPKAEAAAAGPGPRADDWMTTAALGLTVLAAIMLFRGRR